MNFIKKFLSRKLLVAALGMLGAKLTADLGLDPEVTKWALASIGSMVSFYVLGQSWVDGKIKPEDLERIRGGE